MRIMLALSLMSLASTAALQMRPQLRTRLPLRAQGSRSVPLAMAQNDEPEIADRLIGSAVYLLPLLVWHPTQLIVGSFLANPLSKWIAKHRASAEVVAGEAPDDAIEAPPPDSPLVSRKAAS